MKKIASRAISLSCTLTALTSNSPAAAQKVKISEKHSASLCFCEMLHPHLRDYFKTNVEQQHAQQILKC